MILCDTSALIALVNHKDKNHAAVKVFENDQLAIPTTVLCEVDYFLIKYMGDHVAKVFARCPTSHFLRRRDILGHQA